MRNQANAPLQSGDPMSIDSEPSTRAIARAGRRGAKRPQPWPNLSDFGAFLLKIADSEERPTELLAKILALVPSAREGALLCVGQDEGHTIVATTEGFSADVALPPLGPLINSLPRQSLLYRRGELLDLHGNLCGGPYVSMIQGLLGQGHMRGALLYIPFLRQGTLLGALLLRHPERTDAFALAEMQLLEFLAGQTALALEDMYLRKAMSEGRPKLKTLFDVVDVDGIEEQLYVHDLDYNLLIANKSKLQSHHLAPQQIAGQKCYQAFHGRESPCAGCPARETFGTKKSASVELSIPESDKVFKTYTYPLTGEAGDLLGVVHYMRDVTEQKRLEQDNERMARLAALGELSAVIAHEIRNPLSGVGISAQALSRELHPGDFHEANLKNILKGIRKVDDVIKGLLDFANPKEPIPTACAVNRVIEEALFFSGPQAEEGGIAVETSLGRNLPPVLLDPEQIRRVFINIILNALQAMGAGGLLRIRTAKKGEGQVLVRISDTGTGIPQAVLKRIFDPFFTTKSQGAGLGLSISRSILEKHHAAISCETQVGKGTTFTILFPAIKTGLRPEC
ncbi:MAG: PAS domain-containing protein [Nitrospinae bacterium]|nr:PAS domain-containing protein [Nitrospinota bacterium]